MLNFTENFCTMAETKQKKIEKKAYAVMQDALFEKDESGSYSVREMAKEGMTTLKKHSTQLTVILKDESRYVFELLTKNEIPHDKVIKLEEHFDFLVTGEDNSVRAYSWTGALDDLGWKQAREPKKPEDKQKKADKSFSHWFDEQVKNCCVDCGY